MRSAVQLRHIALALTLAAGCPAAGAGAAAQERPGPLVQSRYARVAGDSGAREAAARVAAAIDEAAPRIALLVGAQDLRPITAYVYRERSQFCAATGLPRQSTIVGLATFPPGVMHIDGTGVLATIEKVAPHEVGHIMIARAVGPALRALPLWLNEGIAEYVAGESAAQVDPVALRAIGRGTALELADLDSAIRGGGRGASLAYAESASLVNYLVSERGEGVIAELLGELRNTGDFEAALERATGLGRGELESGWRKSVARRWRWPLLLRSPVLPFGVMVLLFLVGLVRYLRERRRRQDMAEEDW